MRKLIMGALIAGGLYYLRSRQGRPGAQDRPDLQAILDRLDQIPESATSQEKRVLSYLPEIEAASREYSIEKALIAAVMDRESRGIYSAVGKDKEYGLMQILCPTARMMQYKGACEGLFEPAINIWYSTKYLRHQMDRYADRKIKVYWAISAYNRGTARQEGGKFSNQSYVDGVIKRLSRYVYLIHQLEIAGL